MSARASSRRTMFRDLVQAHPLGAFFLLSCAISWAAWVLSASIDLGVVNGPGVVFSTGPALAVMAARRLLVTPAWLAVAGPVTESPAYPTPLALPLDVLGAAAAAAVLSGAWSARRA